MGWGGVGWRGECEAGLGSLDPFEQDPSTVWVRKNCNSVFLQGPRRWQSRDLSPELSVRKSMHFLLEISVLCAQNSGFLIVVNKDCFLEHGEGMCRRTFF